jgi:hypothetical protein
MKWETLNGQILETLEPRLTFEEEEELGNAWRIISGLASPEFPDPEAMHGLMRY